MNPEPSQNVQLNIIQGATFIRTITWYDVNGNVVNLSGYTATMNFRSTVQDTGTPIISLSTSSGIVINATAGTVTFTISSAMTQALTDGQILVYNLFIYSGTGVCTPLMGGQALVFGSTI